MSLGESEGRSAALAGKRLKLTVSEPDVFAQRGDAVQLGTVRRVLLLENDAGQPYEVAFVQLDKTLVYGVHSSEVVSLMTRYAKDELSRVLDGEKVAVNIALEDPSLLRAPVSDPRMRDKSLNFNLGYGTAVLGG